jgi:hypothetical protein
MRLGLLSDILTFPVTGPVHGARFVVEQIRKEVDRQRLDPSGIQRQLLELNERLNSGLISEEEFESAEATLLEELTGIQEDIEAMQAEGESLDDEVTLGSGESAEDPKENNEP